MAIRKNCKTRTTKLSTAWIDYKKGFDGVPHSSMIKCMQLYKIKPKIVTLIQKAMELWHTTVILQHSQGKIEIPAVKMCCGLFQSNSVPTLLFCLPSTHWATLLISTDTDTPWHPIRERPERQERWLYMDDLKLFTSNDKKFAEQPKIVKRYSDDIQMQYSLDKCTFVHGRLTKTDNKNRQNYITGARQRSIIQIPQSRRGPPTICHKEMRKTILKEYRRRMRLILKTYLSQETKSKP